MNASNKNQTVEPVLTGKSLTGIGNSSPPEKNFPVSLSELQAESEKLNFADKSKLVCKVHKKF